MLPRSWYRFANLPQYYGPDYLLDVRASNMENANSMEYLEKIKNTVIENLRRSQPVPSVQMQDIPRASFGLTDEEEAALDDLDDDTHPDQRLTQRRLDKAVARSNEYDDSDDEDMAEQEYGRHKPKRRGIQEFKNPNFVEPEQDSGRASPVPAEKDGDVTMADAEPEQSEKPEDGPTGDSAEAANTQPAAEKVDESGDVAMGEDPENATTDAPIKEEDADAAPATEAQEPTSKEDAADETA